MKTEKQSQLKVAEEDVPGCMGWRARLPAPGRIDGYLSAALVAKEDGQIVGSALLGDLRESAPAALGGGGAAVAGHGSGPPTAEATLKQPAAVKSSVSICSPVSRRSGFLLWFCTHRAHCCGEFAVQQSVEFTAACPTSAQAMKKEL